MTRTTLKIALLAAALTIACAASANAMTLYASPSGTYMDPCTSTQPCGIINAVNTYANDGDEVVVLPGEYDIGTTPLVIGEAVNVHGTDRPDETRITSSGSIAVMVMHAGATLSRLEINHAAGGTQAIQQSAGTVANMKVVSGSPGACGITGGKLVDSICISKGNDGGGVYTNTNNAYFWTVLRNVTAIGKGASNSYGMYATGVGSSGGLNVDAKSSLFYGSTGDIVMYSGITSFVDLTLANCNFSSVTPGFNTSHTSSATNGNQSAEPVFRDEATDNYHQRVTSLATIDLGVVDGSSGTGGDIDLNPRTIDSAPDIGADEFDTSTPGLPTITSHANGSFVASATPTISGTAQSGDIVGVTSGGWELCTARVKNGTFSCTISPRAEGVHTLQAVAYNDSRYSFRLGAEVGLTVDLTAPAVSITSPSAGATVGKSPVIAFSTSDANPGSTSCTIDGAALAGCTSGIVPAALTDGSHTVVVNSTDLAGNVGSATATFTVDATGPVVKKQSVKIKAKKATVKFSATGSNTYKCAVDKAKPISCKSPFKTKKLKKGKHKIVVTGTDAHGNSGPPLKISLKIK